MLFPDAEICDVAFDKIDFVVAPASPDQVASYRQKKKEKKGSKTEQPVVVQQERRNQV